MAAFLPSVAIAYAIYIIVLISVRFGAAHVVSSVVFHPPQLLAQILFTPLLALWSIWVGIGISTRASDVRVAQQLATLAGLPLLGFTSLISFQIVKPLCPARDRPRTRARSQPTSPPGASSPASSTANASSRGQRVHRAGIEADRRSDQQLDPCPARQGRDRHLSLGPLDLSP